LLSNGLSISTSAYLHIPFCQTRCAYCDFNTYAGLDDTMPAYVEALAAEINGVGLSSTASEMAGPGSPFSAPLVHSIYFGGGTPSLLSTRQVGHILAAVRRAFRLAAEPEITLEANPGTVGLGYLEGLREAGVNRLSLGAQSSRPSDLRLLERAHSFPDVIHAVRAARLAGFTNLNLDLMFGLPYQSLAAWRESLSRILDLDPDHVSLYPLSLEFGTPMHAWVERGLLPGPDPDLTADMYGWACEVLKDAGFVHYEISNWARRITPSNGGRPDTACLHNLQYWRNLPYLGFGAGAHGFAAGRRYANVRSPRAYIRRISQGIDFDFPVSPAGVEEREIPSPSEMNETIMLGLRLLEEGVVESSFASRFGVEVGEAFRAPMERLQRDGLIRRGDGRVRLTERAYFIANQVFCMFV
jgi:oxygen-independent coproporphyrinogen-3 oxidase